MSKAVVVFSGGLDSTVLLTNVIRYYQCENVVALNFGYGSKHNKVEREHAENICSSLNVPLIKIDLPFINELFKSDLLQSGGEIPEGYYEDSNMSKTVVPFRNGIMISIAVGYAESIGAQIVLLGAHQGDHAIYPDCREGFINDISSAAQEGTSLEVEIIAPFINMRKEEIVALGLKIGAPLEMTWSCYKGGERPCFACGTCQERTESFLRNTVQDPALSDVEWSKAVEIYNAEKK